MTHFNNSRVSKLHKSFDCSNGFLPHSDPIQKLPDTFSIWEKTASNLPKLLTSAYTHQIIEKLPKFEVAKLKSDAEFDRAMLILSYLGQAYVWSQTKPKDSIPEVLAEPWYKVALKLKRPPVLSYASYALYNWRRIDPKKPIELGNIVLLQNFLGGIDEEWFILIHVDIEAKAIPAISHFIPTQQAVEEKDSESVIQNLKIIKNSLKAMLATLKRMPERCDPYIYFNRVRPYIHGWKDNPALPNGLIYEGVEQYGGIPQKFKGETGAQSSIIPCLDALFGIEHEDNPLKAHLIEMRIYMPKPHREFLEKIEKGASLRKFILNNYHQRPELKDLYNDCIQLISDFRKTHFGYAAQYIQKQSQVSESNPTAVGTGGTPFMDYLRKHLDESEHFLI